MTRTTAKRRLDAAGGKRASKLQSANQINVELLQSNISIRARARGAMLNNPLIRNGVENSVGEIVRTGVMSACPDDDAKSAWEAFNKTADEDKRTNFDGLLAQIVRSVIVDGEAFLQVLDFGGTTTLRLLMPEQIDESKTMRLDDGFVVQGIEFDNSGQRRGYWIRPYVPTDVFPTFPASEFVDAFQILHIMKPVSTGQVRGLSWLAPCLMSAGELNSAVDALIVAAKIGAMHAVIVTDSNDNSDTDPYAPPAELSPGSVVKLPAGMGVTVSNPNQFQQSESLIRQITLQIAAGLGVPEHYCNGNLSNANYSSLRAGLLPFRQRVEQLQTTVLEPQLLNPLWNRVVGGDDASWLWPTFRHVDPSKTISADVAEIEAGLASRSQKIAERGFYPAQIDEQRAQDQQREQTLGLTHDLQESASK